MENPLYGPAMIGTTVNDFPDREDAFSWAILFAGLPINKPVNSLTGSTINARTPPRNGEPNKLIVDEPPLCVIETFADTASDDWRDENILN